MSQLSPLPIPVRENKVRKSKKEAMRELSQLYAAYQRELVTPPADVVLSFALHLEHAGVNTAPYISSQTLFSAQRTLTGRLSSSTVHQFVHVLNAQLKADWSDTRKRMACAHHLRKHRGRQGIGAGLATAGVCSLIFVVGLIPLAIGIDMMDSNNPRYSGPRSSFVISGIDKAISACAARLAKNGARIVVPHSLRQANFNVVRNTEWGFSLRIDIYETPEKLADVIHHELRATLQKSSGYLPPTIGSVSDEAEAYRQAPDAAAAADQPSSPPTPAPARADPDQFQARAQAQVQPQLNPNALRVNSGQASCLALAVRPADDPPPTAPASDQPTRSSPQQDLVPLALVPVPAA